ncbi:GTPase [Cellulomonas fengjieae]|uniref:50S ribosome-binding GTPase n=1 Tax=Cellulomonas fengjieae TaxID=2819978 RepID=A0ABS3SFP2_9CELL|nr:GTPase [Cellulomonas fengjieae]MBO3084573.1 50S ribosome-binding GTPase [Cellulomonas fengjieae]QVI67094.1 50S ribosome-binding GTPase [Cellulomonas fengjieae]
MSAQPGTAPVQPVQTARPLAAHARHAASDPRDVLARPLAATSLLDAVRDLLRDVERTGFPLEIDGITAARASRARLVDQLGEHLVPRLTELSAPAVVVVSGSTGAGKSTLVNSLVGSEVSTAGVLRPTTRRPVLVHNPLDAELLSHHPVLESVTVVADDQVPRGIALLDAPDLDSVLESNRESAHRLLEAADLWLFVTTAARYGDALPWRVLQGAVERGASVAMVLNRVPPASLPTVRGDLLDRLRSNGLQGSPLFVIPDLGPHEGLLPPAVVAPIRRWLAMLAGPDRARTVIGRTLRGSLAALKPWVDELAEAVQAQADAAATIATALDAATEAPIAQAAASVRGGAVADGAVRARWAELAADGGPLGRVVRASGRIRGSAREGRAREAAVEPLVEDLIRSVTATLTAAGAHAEESLRAALTGPDAPQGGGSVDAAWAPPRSARRTAAEQAARAWTAQGARVVRAALSVPPVQTTADGVARSRRDQARDLRRRGKAETALGDGGLAAVALAAASGVREAHDLLVDLVDAAGERAIDELRDDLVARAAAQVAAERATVGEVLADPDLAEDAASRLRLRLAVLKGLT